LKPETCCLLEVADTGTGIPAKYRDRIFDPFFSTKDTPDRKGTGLGLSIVYNTILSYGGNITFRSEENKGTTFQILIPGPRGKFKIERVENGGKMPKGNENILIVDDEKHVRDVVKDSLEWLGYHVSLAGNGKDAIDFIRNSGKKIDLVLLDISMPEMDGEECLREFTTMAPDIPVVIFSGHTGDDIAIRMLKAGAVSFLSKPVDLNELAGTVRHSIDSARKQSTVKNMQSVT
jgi:CheY-like chemotaxis protein